ncbi:MAG: hypothetical protein AVDCRST_MAG87-1663 [uncultured Thermomicrobiales bacterium]|uniref:Uncharacterized protein n=1 Tax=uncultured Thermomicrobiales bacterium TaxID=1645740 RepID=A0A6J4UWT5_9BACT|nr:MAG: hypothetical protein AVDCRST_MAG87-1663 [uncultured Thermomicrobiales bacterium]
MPRCNVHDPFVPFGSIPSGHRSPNDRSGEPSRRPDRKPIGVVTDRAGFPQTYGPFATTVAVRDGLPRIACVLLDGVDRHAAFARSHSALAATGATDVHPVFVSPTPRPRPPGRHPDRAHPVLLTSARCVLGDCTRPGVMRSPFLPRVRRDDASAPVKSYFNDVRFAHGHAFISDSGLGAIVVVDLDTGKVRRLLDGHASTLVEPGIEPMIGGRPWKFPNGKTPQVHVGGFVIDHQGEQVYYKPLVGRTLYRVPIAALLDESLAAAVLGD